MTDDLENLLSEWDDDAFDTNPNGTWQCKGSTIHILTKALRVYRESATAIINEKQISAIQPDGNRISYLKHLAKEANAEVQSILMGGEE